MKTIFQVRVRHGGRIVLPGELRDRSGIEIGTRLTLHDLGNGLIVISRKRNRLSRIADQLANEWREAGITLKSMLAALREVRNEQQRSIP